MTLERSVADVLLDVHRSYFRSVMPVMSQLHGMAHITGGGIPGNLVRILPAGCEAVVDPEELGPAAAVHDAAAGGRDLHRGNARRLQPRRRPHRRAATRAVAAAQAAAAADGVVTWTMGEIRPGAAGRAVRPSVKEISMRLLLLVTTLTLAARRPRRRRNSPTAARSMEAPAASAMPRWTEPGPFTRSRASW